MPEPIEKLFERTAPLLQPGVAERVEGLVTPPSRAMNSFPFLSVFIRTDGRARNSGTDWYRENSGTDCHFSLNGAKNGVWPRAAALPLQVQGAAECGVHFRHAERGQCADFRSH